MNRMCLKVRWMVPGKNSLKRWRRHDIQRVSNDRSNRWLDDFANSFRSWHTLHSLKKTWNEYSNFTASIIKIQQLATRSIDCFDTRNRLTQYQPLDISFAACVPAEYSPKLYVICDQSTFCHVHCMNTGSIELLIAFNSDHHIHWDCTDAWPPIRTDSGVEVCRIDPTTE